MPWARLLAYVTGTVDQELLLHNEYLAAENRIPILVMESAKHVFCPDLESLGQFVPPSLGAQRWILGGLR